MYIQNGIAICFSLCGMRNVDCGLGTFVLKRQSVVSKHTLRKSIEVKPKLFTQNNENTTEICNKVCLNDIKIKYYRFSHLFKLLIKLGLKASGLAFKPLRNQPATHCFHTFTMILTVYIYILASDQETTRVTQPKLIANCFARKSISRQ